MLRRSFITAVALFAAACGSDAPTQPTVVDPGAPSITCPAPPATVQSLDGLAVAVSFGPPVVTGGSTPLTGPTCTPASGTAFPVGATPVTCTVTDAKARAAAPCTFAVTVSKPPKLSLTRFFAFGDSITAGEIPSEGIAASARSQPRLIDFYLNYATDLTRLLAIRYQTQQPAVQNEGVQGETTQAGVSRLPSVISSGNAYQVMLLMEGANDLPAGTPSILPAVQNLQAMIETGKRSGLKVFLANLPPQNPNACGGSSAVPGCIFRAGGAPYVTTFNAFLPGIASAEGVTFVDVYKQFNGDVTTLIDFDGLHPTAAGYTVIAQAFLTAIRQQLELPATAGPTSLTTPFLAAPRRR